MVLISDEDMFKSTFCRKLAFGVDDWFSDSVRNEGSDQNLIPQLFGILVIELAEIDMSKREADAWKSFISRQTDKVTLKYAKLSEKFPRRGIFIATTNRENPLLSDTGNRRFLPVRITQPIDIAWLESNYEQLIAEAATLESAGELFLIPKDVKAAAIAAQEDARDRTPAEVFIQRFFANQPADVYIPKYDLEEAMRKAQVGRLQGKAAKLLRTHGFEVFDRNIIVSAPGGPPMSPGGPPMPPVRPRSERVTGWVKSDHEHTQRWRRIVPHYDNGRVTIGRPDDLRVAQTDAPSADVIPISGRK
jgi:predicted P-loop ATPase